MYRIDAMMKASELPYACCGKPGSTADYKTGDWKSERPVVDVSRCTYCGLCSIVCPEGCFKDMAPAEKWYKPGLDYCKGCGICAHECPRDAIAMIPEEV